MIEYEYRTEETEIMEYTEELREKLKDPNAFSIIFICFKNKDLHSLAKIMATMAEGRNNLKATILQQANTIKWLEVRLAEVENTIARLTAELGELRKQGGGADIQISNEIKTLYEKYGSLRKVGEILHMDKSTVKRKLIKLGFTFD